MLLNESEKVGVMDSRLLVSLITSCYRGEKHLPRFFESVLSQTIADRVEIVIAHNEPTESELKLVWEFTDKFQGHVKHLIIPQRESYSRSWNRCIKQATSAFLAIWNVDDTRTPSSLEDQARVLLEREQIDYVFGNFRVIHEPGSTQGELIDAAKSPTADWSHAGMLLGPFFMFRKGVCGRTGYCDEQLSVAADYDFAIRLALNAKGAITDTELGYFLDIKEGLSTKFDSLVLAESLIVELRYGIYKRINYEYIHATSRYNIPYIKQYGEWVRVADLVPGYNELIADRFEQWYCIGLNRYYWLLGVFSWFLQPVQRIGGALRRRLLWILKS